MLLGVLNGAASFSSVIDLIRVLVWPTVVLIAILIAVSDRGRRLLRPILRRLRKVSGGGFAVELSSEVAAATKSDVEGAIRDFSQPLRDEFERLAYAYNVREHLAGTVEELLAGDAEWKQNGHRATVHVRDALFLDALYQLADYWPTGGGSGRRYSTRFGMLGRAWRLGSSQYEDDVTRTPDELVSEWGMTREQAERVGRDRQSIFCGALRYEDVLVGMFYMDAKAQEAFPVDIEDRFENSKTAENLAIAVGKVRRDIADRGPGIKLLQSD